MTPRTRQLNPTVVSWLEWFSRTASTLVSAIGFFVLLSWALDVGAPWTVVMTANAAVAFILAGASLRLAELDGAGRAQLASRCCALAIVALGVLTLSEDLLGWNLHIDQLLVRDTAAVVANSPPGRMAPAEAGSFVLIGIALYLLHDEWPTVQKAVQALALTAALLSGQALLGHAYGVALYVIPSYRYTRVGFHTALAFTLLCAGVLSRRPGTGVMAVFSGDSGGGYMARRLLPAAFGALSVLGWMRLAGERAGYYDTAAGEGLMVVGTLIFFAVLIGWNARAVEKLEEERARLIREQMTRAQAEAAGQRAAFLARTSETLSASLDYRSTLGSVTRLAVPYVADWCVLSVLDADDAVRLMEVAHMDPAKMALAREIEARYPMSVRSPYGPGRVIRTGVPELVSEITESWLGAMAQDAEHLRLLKGLGTTSYMVVPLIAREQTFGALAFVAAESGRHFDRTDLALAEELAHRAALAIDNARLYEAEVQARASAEGASRAKDAFLATVSHELRTPLSPILAWSRMLRQGSLDADKQRRALEAIERCARSQAQLVDDLLDVSRIITGKLRLEVRPVALAPVIQAALEVVRPAADAKAIRLQTVLDADVGMVAGDPERLKQVLWNLVSNAVKFTPRGGRVQVVLERVEAQVQITVIDTGQGIPPEFLTHVFQRFEQADGTSTRAHGGLGLGLAIVRHLVELHGGTVRAESPGEGEGAVFTVTLPLLATETRREEGSVPRTPGAPPAAGLPTLEGIRVLVVDDEPDSNDVVGTLLSTCGAEVRVAASAGQAVEVLAMWKPDVLVTDIAMPNEDGYALLARVRSGVDESQQILAVALTAYASRDDRVRMLSAGFQAHVAKPVDPSELATVIASLGETAHRLRAS